MQLLIMFWHVHRTDYNSKFSFSPWAMLNESFSKIHFLVFALPRMTQCEESTPGTMDSLLIYFLELETKTWA